MTPINGNTYPVKDKLRAIGGKWDAARKCWLVPDNRADEARKLVANAPASQRPSKPKSTCYSCGCEFYGYGDYCGC